MNFLFRQFKKQQFNFNSEWDTEALDAEMLKFCDRSFWNFSINLKGRVRTKGGYSFTRRWQFGTYE
jgi:hypothetical protein